MNTIAAASAPETIPAFHPCPPAPDCPYCNGTTPQPYDWTFVDRAYCISLRSRPERTARAAAHFHRMGLCQRLTFYRPSRHPTRVVAGIWESHRQVAQDALANGYTNILVFEDDARFLGRTTPEAVRHVGSEIQRLPADWMIFFLGHWPFWAWFLTARTLRVSSACAHAYIANRRLLEWLVSHPFETRRRLPRRRIAGKGIDAYFAKLPGTYAFFPMIAIQDGSPSDHFAESRAKRSLRLHHLITRPLWFEKIFARLPLLFEIYAVVLAIPLTLWQRLIRPIVRPRESRPLP